MHRPFALALLVGTLLPQYVRSQDVEKLNTLVVEAPRDGDDRTDGDFSIPLAGGRGYLDWLNTLPNARSGTTSSTAFALRGVAQDNVFYSIGTSSNTLVNFSNGGLPGSYASLASTPPLMWDMEQVSVTRGPVLFGAGQAVMGGEVRLEPRAPRFFQEGRVLLEAGEYDSWRAGFTENAVLIPDKLAWRFNLASEGTDNAVTNLYDFDDEFAATERRTIRNQLRWRPAGNDEEVFDLRVDLERGSGNAYGQAFLLPGGDFYDRVVNVNTPAILPSDLWGTVLRARIERPDGGWFEGEATFQNLVAGYHTDFDATPFLNWFYDYQPQERRLTGSARFGRNTAGFEWTGGLYAETSDYDLVFKGVGFGPIPTGSPFHSHTNEDVDIAAAFGHARWEFTRNWWLAGGLRLDAQWRDQDSQTFFNGAPTGADQASVENAEWLPELGVEWDNTRDMTAGVKIARSYRPGGASFAPTLGLLQPYGPERGWEIDAETTKRWQSLQVTGRLFQAWLDHQQVPYVPAGGFPVVDSFITNSASSTRNGAEVEVQWQHGDFLANATAGYLHTSFDRLVLHGVDRSGQSFPLSPEWTASCGIAWQPREGWFGSLVQDWSDPCYTQAQSPGVTKLEARLLLSARAGYRWKNLEAYLFGNNLLDENYALSKTDYRVVGLPVAGQLGMPRVLGVGVSLSW